MQVSILRLMNYRKKRQHNAKIRFHSQGLCRKGAVPLFLIIFLKKCIFLLLIFK